MNKATLASMGGAAGVFELVCGALVVVGLLTRPAAFLLSGVTAVAYFLVHAPRGFFPPSSMEASWLRFTALCFSTCRLQVPGH
jgi:uncharacterized membrane protein YphA (DoxX/SURF4 family)